MSRFAPFGAALAFSALRRETDMLRISHSDTGTSHTWHLCGQLAGAWVEELRLCWKHANRAAPGKRTVMDLRDVTFVDEGGERLLSEMRRDGVQFVAVGVETRDLVDNLNGTDERPLRRLLGRVGRTDG